LLLTVTGFGVAAGNWPALAICVMLPLLALRRRICVEEAELTRVLGDRYRAYKGADQASDPWPLVIERLR